MIPDRMRIAVVARHSAFLLLLLLASCRSAAGIDPAADNFAAQPALPETRTVLETSRAAGNGMSSDVLQAAISTSADAILNAINLRRTQEGLLPWLVESALVEIAYERSIDMAVQGYLDHAAPGSDEAPWLSALQERAYFGQAAELVFATQESLQAVSQETLRTWFSDADHEAVLFSPVFRYAGLGLMGDGSRWIVTLIVVEGRP
ncbi:MAG: CAP domain-containing protein [Anaerolineales bacterium]|nr:MAG: CAP domain-containing protein [Anaerolineales bacterium]